MSRLGLYLGAGEQAARGERLWLYRISGVCLFSVAEIQLPFYCFVKNFVWAEWVPALYMVFHIVILNILRVKEKLF